MPCSLSTVKSSSKWLDRLRSAKGFPTGADVNLDQFLNHTNSELSNYPETDICCSDIAPKLDSSSSDELIEESVIEGNQTADISNPADEENGWLGVISDVLAELFCIEDSNGGVSRRKVQRSCRKQPNPRVFVLPAPSAVGNEIENRRRTNGGSGTSRLNCDYSFVKRNRTSYSLKESVDVAEDDKSPSDLSGFSRTEVTVIDTSNQAWKCEKLLFRKKNVWRVRDNKRKNKNFGMKMNKRKANMVELQNSGREKKLQQCSSSRDGNGEQILDPASDEHQRRSSTNGGGPGCKETVDIPWENSESRFFLRNQRR